MEQIGVDLPPNWSLEEFRPIHRIFCSLAGRSLSLLFSIGWGLAFDIGLTVNAILSDGTLYMLPSGSSTEPDSPSCEPSGLEQKEVELIKENLSVRKTEIIAGQDPHEVRKAMEDDSKTETVVDQFTNIQQLIKEKEKGNQNCPLTKSSLNEVKDFQSHVQDGRGGKTTEEMRKKFKKERSTQRG